MSCYFRHIEDIFQEAGISVSSNNRKRIDLAIHQIVGSTHDNCPETWKHLKQHIIGDEQKRREFINKLRDCL